MKAIVYAEYGGPEVLTLQDIEKPSINDDQVLVRVSAAGANPYDWHFMRGEPKFMRLMSGLLTPKDRRLGADLAGVVEAVGKHVTAFQPGDEVYGLVAGAYAEYVRAGVKSIAPKPANLSFEDAAALPIAGVTALQSLDNIRDGLSGKRVLINGASGGVGTFAVQIAKAQGAEVTGVCSTRNIELVRSLGADHVVDYTQEDLTKSGETYDLFLDNVGNHPLSACQQMLTASGRYRMIGADRGSDGYLKRMAGMFLRSLFSSRKMSGVMAKINRDELLRLNEFIEAEKVRPVIDRTYSLEEVPEAIRYLEDGHVRGKIVVTI